MWKSISKFFKQFFISFIKDIINDILGYGIVLFILILAMLVVNYIEDDLTAMGIIGVIVLVVYSIVFFYQGKE
ncbi:hypothetical protein DM877_01000 [Enterobacter cloacae]|uniref:Uncharacterized protein n=1 Tax=Enterobacter cloacae TaxID=550 RepID=A0A4Q2EF94_ENTCL|nr:hypothetical protein DM877_01000 [Enterobacter cloacae]